MKYPAVRLAMLFALLGATTVNAMMLKVPPEDIAAKSSDAIEATVIDVESRWMSGQRGIETLTTLEVTESWSNKYLAGERVVVITEGGTIDDLQQWVEHEPQFRPEESVVLFVREAGQGLLRCVASEQGKYTRVGKYIVGTDQEPQDFDEFKSKLAPSLGRGGEER